MSADYAREEIRDFAVRQGWSVTGRDGGAGPLTVRKGDRMITANFARNGTVKTAIVTEGSQRPRAITGRDKIGAIRTELAR